MPVDAVLENVGTPNTRVWPAFTGESRHDDSPRRRTERIMPVGKGIYEDEPREHRHTYQPGPDRADSPKGRDENGRDPAPDDTATDNAPEPTG
ncbi:hypothetical protein [Mycolicibacterium madagascariense]|uniref:hypothetical protein n=1 Tax=Mycolicibacterium madagascariense TaxID=212765 RepID=UPI001C65A7F1|nr:hypothetical protein [Mycolicibacterium madagascariense]